MMRAAMTGIPSLAASWREQFLDFLFPPRCVACRGVGAALCSNCRSQINPVLPPYCPRCGAPRTGRQPCKCRAFLLRITRIRSAGFFEGPLREAIHAFKYKSTGSLTHVLVDLLVQELVRDPVDYDQIVPVPLHPTRERERGYNQAELLARELAVRTGIPFTAGLERVRPTADQIGLDIASRHANMRDAFQTRAGLFRPHRVLLIDDVCTTGATLDACAVALQAEGATTVYGLTVARPR